jgi:glutamate-ammonia-ligase adenylyltransferase
MQDIIQTKRDGIFAIDLQLRPYGNDGPLACSLESFCRYYIKDGPAHSYERLALVRLRAVGGDAELGAQVERLRDEYIYTTQSINPAEIRELREKQYQQKVKPGQLNAKFSQGALVDLEYDVQLLQVMYGSGNELLRTPRIRRALDTLASMGVLDAEEGLQLVAAYDFLRMLINGLRMLRGSAEDLFLPPQESDEFEHLARRMGYVEKNGLTASQQVHTEFETHTARIRAFAERRFGRDSLPGPPGGNIADIVLSQSLPPELASDILSADGFKNPKRALYNIRTMTATPETKDIFSHLAVLAVDMLRHKPDQDMAFNNWQRFTERIDSLKDHYRELLSQPMRLDILLSIFSSSQWLADTLIVHAEFFDLVTTPEILHHRFSQHELEQELEQVAVRCDSHGAWLDELRRYRKREILRIGTRDICLKTPMRIIMADISALAGAVVQVALSRAWENIRAEMNLPGREFELLSSSLCVIAFGKLGGNELNYSSDIDLLGIYDVPFGESGLDAPAINQVFSSLMEKLCSDLSNHTGEGYAYRVDMRLRPYGHSGTLAWSVDKLFEYYHTTAAQWELQALLKMRPIAGNLLVGKNFEREAARLLAQPVSETVVVKSIEHMRVLAIKQITPRSIDIKNGRGSIRDIEFLVQGLQRIYAHDNPGLITSTTLDALALLGKTGILPLAAVQNLEQYYLLFRRIEHFLQLMEDCQVHTLPRADEEREILAKRVLGSQASLSEFESQLGRAFDEVIALYSEYLLSRGRVAR